MIDKHELYQYFKVSERKDGTIVVSSKNLTTHHQVNIFKKLGELGYEIKEEKPLMLCKPADITFKCITNRSRIKHILIDTFLEYLSSLDLSCFGGRITNDDLRNSVFRDGCIKMNGLIAHINS